MLLRPKILLAGVGAAIAAAGFAQTPPGEPGYGLRPGRGGGRGGDPFWNANEGAGNWVRIEGHSPDGRTPPTYVNEDTVRTARETVSHSTGTPEWKNPKGFEKDVFTFARVIFRTTRDDSDIWNYQGRLGWWVDYPDADLNFSYRLQQMTSAKVDPDCRVLKLTDPALADYPLIYMTHVENMRLPDDQVAILRHYLLNGGVLLVNDFWNDLSWRKFATEMKRVLPGREWTELTADHPIFHCVFDLKGPMAKWQVPTLHFWNGPGSGFGSTKPLQWRDRGPGSETMHVRALLDDKGRMLALAIHNSDVGDGWEREGELDEYFHTFSEKIAYPLGINLVFYLMTH